MSQEKASDEKQALDGQVSLAAPSVTWFGGDGKTIWLTAQAVKYDIMKTSIF